MTPTEQDKAIEELIEYWDFQPHQDEDARWVANRNKLRSLINQQVYAALEEVELAVKSGGVHGALSAIEEIQGRYKA